MERITNYSVQEIDSQTQENDLKAARGKGWRGKDRESGMDRYTRLYLKWITNKDLLYSSGNTAQCYVSAWMGGEFEGEWIHVWLSPFAVHLKRP